jgi:hypothetical protein
MVGLHGRTLALTGEILAMVVIGALSASHVLGAGGGGSQSQAAPLNDPAYVACERSGEPLCNSAAWKTLFAGNPVAQPPSAHPRLISRSWAVALALKVPDDGNSQSALPTSEVHARLMKLREYEKLEGQGHDYVINPHRLLWVVTVHAPLTIRVGFGTRTYNIYTLVIDAQTGSSYHMCTCDVVRNG